MLKLETLYLEQGPRQHPNEQRRNIPHPLGHGERGICMIASRQGLCDIETMAETFIQLWHVPISTDEFPPPPLKGAGGYLSNALNLARTKWSCELIRL